jgi:hypothetical protein
LDQTQTLLIFEGSDMREEIKVFGQTVFIRTVHLGSPA